MGSESVMESNMNLWVPKSGTDSDTCGFRNLEQNLIPVGSEICDGDVGRLAVDEMGNLRDDAVRLTHLHFVQLGKDHDK